MKIHVVGGHETIGIREEPRKERFYLRVDRWELSDWLKAKLYHWYDMRVPPIRWWDKWSRHLPGDIDRVIGFRKEPARWYDHIKAWSISQDFRCFELSRKHETLETWEVDEDTYHQVFPRYVPKPPMTRRLRDTFRATPSKEAQVGSSSEDLTAGDEPSADAPAVEVSGDDPNVEVNQPAEGNEEEAPNALPEDDDSRAPSNDDEPDGDDSGD